MNKTTVIPSSEAGRAVASNLHARRQQAARDASYNRDTPLVTADDAEQDAAPLFVGKAPLEQLPDPPVATAPDLPTIEIQTTVAHRGRAFTVVARSYTLDQLCDMLDKRGYAPAEPNTPAAPLAAADDLPEGWKLCRKHGAPMRPRNKQNEHWHSHNVGTSDSPCWCKGYPGADSPGYER